MTERACAGRNGGAGRAGMGIGCPNCGGQADRIDMGRPPMREAGYRCRHCGSTAVFLEKCGPEGGCDGR